MTKTALLATIAALPLLASGCFNPYACRSSADAQGISFPGDDPGLVAYSYGPSPHVALQAGDTTTAISQVYDANACGVTSGAKYGSLDKPARFSWISSDPGIAAVDSRGRIRGITRGQARIQVQASGAETHSILVDVIPQVASIVVMPKTVTVTVGDTLRFDAYLADAAGNPIEFPYDFPYPVNLRTTDAQQYEVENWIPGTRLQLLKKFKSAGTFPLHLVTVVRNVKLDNAAVVTVVP